MGLCRLPESGSMHRPIRRVARLLLASVGLTSCVWIDTLGQPDIAEIDESLGLARLGPAWARDAVARRVRYLEPMEVEECAIYDGLSGRAELFVAAVTEDHYALADTLNIERAIERFSFLRERAADIGPSGRVSVGPAIVFYRAFYFPAEARSCVGFKASWNDVAYDPERRPSALLFGYHCAAPGASLDAYTIEESIAEFEFGRPPEAPPVPPVPEVRAAALALARGTAGGGAIGLPDFPLLLARPYQEDDRTGPLPSF